MHVWKLNEEEDELDWYEYPRCYRHHKVSNYT